MEEDGGKRGRETAATQSAADRKIKERDAVGSRHRFVRRERENERTRRADGEKYQKSRVHHASALSSRLRSYPPLSLSLSLSLARGENLLETICTGYAREVYPTAMLHFRIGLRSFYYCGSKAGLTIVLLTLPRMQLNAARNGGNDHRYKAELSITKREEKLMEHPFQMLQGCFKYRRYPSRDSTKSPENLLCRIRGDANSLHRIVLLPTAGTTISLSTFR